MSAPPTLLIATSNAGKVAEFRRLLPPDIRVIGLAEAGVTLPEETGATFSENARLKALSAARDSGLLALADDSGLEVDALGGEPGVRSARFAGEPASDERNRNLVLERLDGVNGPLRAARFTCVIVVADAQGIAVEGRGECRGIIAESARGDRGFGYDPIFELPDGRTMAELAPEEKDRTSHRGAAWREIEPALLARLRGTS